MDVTPFWRRFAAWLAVFAMGLNALWPLVSLAKPARMGASAGICTASGFRLVGPPLEQPGPQNASHERAQCVQCGFCASPAGHAGLASSNVQAVPFSSASGIRAAPRYDSTPRSRAWIPGARPRAPPLPSALS